MRIFQVDVFTDKPFSGNPAAVCILTQEQSERWMQNVAREMNLSETSFLLRQGDDFNLRWFTPAVEIDLCGHATLASAHILWEEGYLKPDEEARFHTRSGLLIAKRKDGWVELDFPIERENKTSYPPELPEALGITPKYVGKNRFDYLVEVDSEETVRKIKPDFAILETIPMRGVMVTSIAKSPGYDFVSRFFAPMSGVNEDPVTGSSHCCLGPFWQNRLNRDKFIAYQASERGGILRVCVGEDRVYISGQAVTVLRGELV